MYLHDRRVYARGRTCTTHASYIHIDTPIRSSTRIHARLHIYIIYISIYIESIREKEECRSEKKWTEWDTKSKENTVAGYRFYLTFKDTKRIHAYVHTSRRRFYTRDIFKGSLVPCQSTFRGPVVRANVTLIITTTTTPSLSPKPRYRHHHYYYREHELLSTIIVK